MDAPWKLLTNRIFLRALPDASERGRRVIYVLFYGGFFPRMVTVIMRLQTVVHLLHNITM